MLYENLYPKIYELFLEKVLLEFQDVTIYTFDVNDAERTRFPYIVIYPLSLPRKRYLADQRNIEFDFRVRFVDRVPISDVVDASKRLLALLGKFVDQFDCKYYNIEINDNDVSLLGDTRDSGVSSTFIRDNAYVLMAFTLVYHLETAKYKKEG